MAHSSKLKQELAHIDFVCEGGSPYDLSYLGHVNAAKKRHANEGRGGVVLTRDPYSAQMVHVRVPTRRNKEYDGD